MADEPVTPAEPPAPGTLVARFVDRRYFWRGNNTYVERSPRAGGRWRDRVIPELPSYAKLETP